MVNSTDPGRLEASRDDYDLDEKVGIQSSHHHVENDPGPETSLTKAQQKKLMQVYLLPVSV